MFPVLQSYKPIISFLSPTVVRTSHSLYAEYDFSIILNSLRLLATLRKPIKHVCRWLSHADVTKEKSCPKKAISTNDFSSLYASLSFLERF